MNAIDTITIERQMIRAIHDDLFILVGNNMVINSNLSRLIKQRREIARHYMSGKVDEFNMVYLIDTFNRVNDEIKAIIGL